MSHATVDKDPKPKNGPINNEEYCSICEDGGELLMCDGQCGRSFHYKCLNLDSLPDDDIWLCDQCKSGKYVCYICKEDNTKVPTRKCSILTCYKYYHVDCAQENPNTQMQDANNFICSRHICDLCLQAEFDNTTIMQCFRCPTAYHHECALSSGLIFDMFDANFMVCAKHVHVNINFILIIITPPTS